MSAAIREGMQAAFLVAVMFYLAAHLDSDPKPDPKVVAAEQHVKDICDVRGTPTVRDNKGRLVCVDSSPSWAMAHPMYAKQVQPK